MVFGGLNFLCGKYCFPTSLVVSLLCNADSYNHLDLVALKHLLTFCGRSALTDGLEGLFSQYRASAGGYKPARDIAVPVLQKISFRSVVTSSAAGERQFSVPQDAGMSCLL